MPAEEPGSPAAAPEATRIAARAGIVAAFTLVSRVTGYVRDAVLANVFGAGPAQDAFIAAQTIPNTLRRLVAEGALMIAFVPLLSEAKSEGQLEAMRRFTAAVLGVLLPILILLTGLGLLFPEATVFLFASGFDAERAALASDLTRIMMPYLFFISLVAVAGGALNVAGVFGAPAAAPILLNVFLIAGPLFLRGFFDVPIHVAGWAFTIGGAAQLVLQVPWLVRRGLFVMPRFDPRHPKVVVLMKRMVPALFGVGVYQLNMIVIRQIASFLPTGQLSCYFWASRLQEFALGVFAVSIGIASLPAMSEHAARGDRAALDATFRRALRATNFVTIPAMAGLFVLAEPIVGVLFRHGRFTIEDAVLTTTLTQIMAIGLVPIGLVRVIVPTYYAVGDTKTPVVAASASLLSTIVFGWLGARYEIAGLTIATTLSAIAQLVVLLGLLRRRIDRAMATARPERPSGEPTLWSHALRCTVAAAPAVGLGYAGSFGRAWYGGDNIVGGLYLFALVAIVAATYGGLARVLRVPEVDLALGLVRRRLGRRRAM
jgi:putative peptidoglycan lipid II flippase